MPLHFDRYRKVAGIERIVSAEETFRRARPRAEAMGVTRLADITGLDRVGLPIYSAIVPRSEDGISVYAGKGLRPIDAKAGALMEAIERQTALRADLSTVTGSFKDLQLTHSILNPRRLIEQLAPDYSETTVYSWVRGVEMGSDLEILVPASFAAYMWHNDPFPSSFVVNSSSGMASGNCREEAICQALCELIERDAWTLAELGAHCIPWARRCLVGKGTLAEVSDDFEFFPTLDLEEEEVLGLFHQADLFPVVRDITSDIGVPTVFAAVADEMIPGFPMVHCGLGTHPNARVAARRAITEVAQSRCVDIQGVREDLVSADSSSSAFSLHTRRASRVNRDMWCLKESPILLPISSCHSVVNSDIRSDLDFLLSRLAACGLNQAIVVDFSTPDSEFAVVRVIVPGLESWAVNHGRVGPRALAFWKKYA